MSVLKPQKHCFKKCCFLQKTGLGIVFLFGINHTKLYTCLRSISCSLLLAFVLQAAIFWWVFNVTLWEQELFNYLLWLCSIQALVTVVCFSWMFPLDCAFLRACVLMKCSLVFISLKEVGEHTWVDRMLNTNTNTQEPV